MLAVQLFQVTSHFAVPSDDLGGLLIVVLPRSPHNLRSVDLIPELIGHQIRAVAPTCRHIFQIISYIFFAGWLFKKFGYVFCGAAVLIVIGISVPAPIRKFLRLVVKVLPMKQGKPKKNPQLFRCLEPPVHFPGILLIILVQPFPVLRKRQLIITGSPLEKSNWVRFAPF